MLLILFPGNCTFLLFCFRNGQKKWISLKRLVYLLFLSQYECRPLLRAWKMAFLIPSVQIALPPLRLRVLVDSTLTWKAHAIPFLEGRAGYLCLPLPISSPPLSYLSLCPWRLMDTASAGLRCPLVSNGSASGELQRNCGWKKSVVRIYSSSLLHVGSLQVSCIPWPKVTALVGYSWVSLHPLAPSHPTVTSTLALCFLIPTALKSPFIKLFSKKTAICFLLGP